MPARTPLFRAAQVLTTEGPAGLVDRLAQRVRPLPPAPDPGRLLAFARTQAHDRNAALFQPWHVAQHRARRAGPALPEGGAIADARRPDTAGTADTAGHSSPHWSSPDWDAVDPVTLRGMDGRQLWPGALPPAGEPPQVSVVTRTLGDRPWLLAQAIASVLNQAGLGVEHVIVQDGGGDSMAPLCARVRQVYGADCRHIAAGRVGRSAAANAGVAAARATLVLLLDDDDLLLPHHAALLGAAMADAPAAPAAHALAWEVPSTLPPDAPPVEAAYIRHPHQALGFSRRRLARVNHLPIQSVLFRADAYARCGGMDASLDLLEDWDLWRRMAALGDFVRVPRLTSLYRVPADPAAAAARRAALAGTPAR